MLNKAAHHTSPPGDDWILWTQHNPTIILLKGACLEVWRVEWGNDTYFVTGKALHLATNTTGLWWRKA